MVDHPFQVLLSFLPEDAKQLLLNPPSFDSPSSFVPALRLLMPLAKYFVVILAFWIVWSTIAGVLGYFTRFMRFGMKIGPIIGIIAWLMASSGQGSLNDLFSVVKQWAGLESTGGGGNIPAGIAGLANLFDNKKSSTGYRSSSKRKSSKKDPSVVESLFRSAAEVAQGAEGGNWQGVVQDYVKQAVQNSLGFEWPFGGSSTEESDTRRRTRSR